MYCVGWSKLRVQRPQEGGGMYCVGWSKLRVQRPQEGGVNVLCWLVKTTG